jgi:hypothetical protein
MIGRVGQAEKEGEAKQEIAKIDAKTAVLETERKVEKANADQKLKTREILISRDLKLEQIAAQRAAEQKDAELQKNVEQKRAEMELERLRATTVTQAKIAKESAQQKADADLYTQETMSKAACMNFPLLTCKNEHSLLTSNLRQTSTPPRSLTLPTTNSPRKLPHFSKLAPKKPRQPTFSRPAKPKQHTSLAPVMPKQPTYPARKNPKVFSRWRRPTAL